MPLDLIIKLFMGGLQEKQARRPRDGGVVMGVMGRQETEVVGENICLKNEMVGVGCQVHHSLHI